MSAEEVAQAFVQHFYQAFDSNVDSLAGLFVSLLLLVLMARTRRRRVGRRRGNNKDFRFDLGRRLAKRQRHRKCSLDSAFVRNCHHARSLCFRRRVWMWWLEMLLADMGFWCMRRWYGRFHITDVYWLSCYLDPFHNNAGCSNDETLPLPVFFFMTCIIMTLIFFGRSHVIFSVFSLPFLLTMHNIMHNPHATQRTSNLC